MGDAIKLPMKILLAKKRLNQSRRINYIYPGPNLPFYQSMGVIAMKSRGK